MLLLNLFRLTAVLGLACIVAGQTEPHTIEGVLLDSISGKPIPNGAVLLYAVPRTSPSMSSARSSADGRFILNALNTNRVLVSASAPNYVAVELTVVLVPGARTDVPPIRLTPAGAIIGRVLNTNGRPVVGMFIRAEPVTAEGRRAAPFTQRDLTTNNRGEFRLGNLPPGIYAIVLSATRSRAATTDAPFYHPGVKDALYATHIEVRPGEDTRISDMVLQPQDLAPGSRGSPQ